MRLTLLGTGTSFGIPQVGCTCEVCRSDDPHDTRTRTGALVESGDTTILIDTPPELRQQLVRAGTRRLDAVLYTHEHADHTAGIDDLRIFTVKQRGPLPVYGPQETLERLRQGFQYIFDDGIQPYAGTSKPLLHPEPIEAGTGAHRGRDRTHRGRGAGSPVGVRSRAFPRVRLPLRPDGVHY